MNLNVSINIPLYIYFEKIESLNIWKLKLQDP